MDQRHLHTSGSYRSADYQRLPTRGASDQPPITGRKMAARKFFSRPTSYIPSASVRLLLTFYVLFGYV